MPNDVADWSNPVSLPPRNIINYVPPTGAFTKTGIVVGTDGIQLLIGFGGPFTLSTVGFLTVTGEQSGIEYLSYSNTQVRGFLENNTDVIITPPILPHDTSVSITTTFDQSATVCVAALLAPITPTGTIVQGAGTLAAIAVEGVAGGVKVPITLSDVSGTGITLNQKPMTSSLPVTLASDQPALPVLYPTAIQSGSVTNGGVALAAPPAGKSNYVFSISAHAAAGDICSVGGLPLTVCKEASVIAGTEVMIPVVYSTPIKFSGVLVYSAFSVNQSATISIAYTQA